VAHKEKYLKEISPNDDNLFPLREFNLLQPYMASDGHYIGQI